MIVILIILAIHFICVAIAYSFVFGEIYLSYGSYENFDLSVKYNQEILSKYKRAFILLFFWEYTLLYYSIKYSYISIVEVYKIANLFFKTKTKKLVKECDNKDISVIQSESTYREPSKQLCPHCNKEIKL